MVDHLDRNAAGRRASRKKSPLNTPIFKETRLRQLGVYNSRPSTPFGAAPEILFKAVEILEAMPFDEYIALGLVEILPHHLAYQFAK